MKKESLEIWHDLIEQGYDDQDIKDIMIDSEYFESINI